MPKRLPNGLIHKFLLVFVAVFLIPTSYGFWQLIHYDTKAELGKLTARIGNQAARATLALDRHDAIGNALLARDLVAPLTADRAVECVDIERGDASGDGIPVVTGLECGAGGPMLHKLVLPIGEGELSLVVQFTEKEILEQAALSRKVLFGGLFLAVLISVVSAWIGFRIVVGRRMSSLNSALQNIARGGEREQVEPGSNDELGQIMGAFNRMILREARRERELQDADSALRRANDKLASLTRESEQRFRDFVASASDWYWEMDDQLRFSYFSDRFTEVSGVPKEKLLGKTRRDTGIPNVDEDSWEIHLATLDAHESFRNFEHPRTKENGDVVWLSINGTPVFDDDGTFRGYRGTGTDVTQRVRAKELMREKAISEQMARAKGEFLANMSHEIRTPINGVLGMTEILLKTPLDGNQRRFATTIHRSGEALLRVINDILDFSKIEAGKMSLQSAPFDVRELMEDIGELFAESAHSKGLELICQTPVDLACDVRGDAGRLRQVLTNLVGNAVKFTERGEVLVRVGAIEQTDTRIELGFEVRDTGIGIPVDAQAQVFDSFAQVDGSNERRYGGTGLGLAISAQLVKLMGGDIGVDSTPGEGSTFWFTVSLETEQRALAAETEERDLAGARVLVVDDNATNREILEHQLGAWGMVYDSAVDAFDALEKIEHASAQPYQLIVLDMHMPGMNGLALAEKLDADARTSALKKIMLSSVCDAMHERRDASDTIDAYLLKPVRQSELRRCLRSVLASASDSRCSVGAETDASSDGVAPQFAAKILLAEDNLVNQEVALSWLEPMGATVTVAEHGEATVDAWRNDEFDLIFMDCQMPGMNGFEATVKIRELQSELERRAVPIVALTANALQGDKQRCIEAGMDDYLSKPYTEEQLVGVLSRWLPGVGGASLEPVEKPVADLEVELEAVLDASVIESYREREQRSGRKVFARIVDAFLSQSNEHMAALRSAADEGDVGRMREASHTLKSSCAQVGALGLSELMKTIETRAADGDVDGMREAVPRVDLLYPRVCEALQAETQEQAA